MKSCHNYNHQKESEYFTKTLKDQGSRLTEQRLLLIDTILQFDRPFSAEDVLIKLKKSSIDLATIYRSLALFLDLKLLSTVDFSDGITRYEYLSEEAHHHHHIICTSCKKVEPVEFCVSQGQKKIHKTLNYSNISHKLEFFGTCQDCLP